MKKVKYYKFLIIVLFSLLSITSYGQMLEPDDPGGDPVGEDPLGGGAPISGGTLLLISMGVAYGASRLYVFKASNKK